MREARIAVVFGTRPEIVKLAPVLWALGPTVHTVHTGQHYDPALSERFLDELGLGPPAVQLGVGSGSRAEQVATALTRLDRVFAGDRPDVVVVQGDTNSTLAGALAANARDLPLVHVEAGLRSDDRSMPEEHNRIVVDHLADLCCTPTETARARLAREGISGARVTLTGNTVVDAVQRLLPDDAVRDRVLQRFGLLPASFALATFHRPENVDADVALRTVLHELATLPIPVVLPLHPRTRARVHELGLSAGSGALRVVEPLGYCDFIALLRECAFAISDSGGVQEEASVLRRPVIVVRASTERPEVVGTFAELVPVGPAIGEQARAWTTDIPALHARLAKLTCPFGDGRAGPRTAKAISDLLGRAP